MSGWGGLGGWIVDLGGRRDAAGDSSNTSPPANATRRACDWVARKGLGPAIAAPAHYVCGPYWDDAPYEPPGDPEPPFEGGQCVGVSYRGTWFLPGSQISLVSFSGLGPIGELANGDFVSESGNQTTRRYGFVGKNSQGNDVPLFSEVTRLTSEGPLDFGGLIRLDGQPDDCGSPPLPDNPRDPVDLPPGRLPPDGQPVDISDPNDPNDTTPPIIFAPNPPPEYEPFVPFSPSFPGAPPFAFPPSPGDDIPPRVGEPTDIPPGGTGDDDVETPDNDLPDECIGYSWEFYDIPANRGGVPDASPRRFYEIFGSAQLRVSSRDAAIYDSPVKIDSARGVCYRSDKNLRVRGLSLNSKTTFGPVRVRPVYVVVREN